MLLARPKATTQGSRRVARSAASLVRANPPTGHHPPALSPLAIGHLRSATRRLLQCQPPAGPSAHSLVQFLVARHARYSHIDSSHQLAHLRIRQCKSWCRDPPDRTTNDSHEGHQVVLETELIDLHATKQPQPTRSARHTHRKKRNALTCPCRCLKASCWARTKIFSHTHHH